MKIIRITDISNIYFEQAWKLYEDSFPTDERRQISNQTNIMEKINYNFEIITKDNHFIGILLWWDYNNFRYIEHLATLPKERCKGFGKTILEQFINRDTKPIILEVDLPESNINKRRIEFYKRIGFKLNNHYYKQTPYNKESSSVELLLMSYPSCISKTMLDVFLKNIASNKIDT
ncbi:MAG: GNAT family N-acetyltransferase [Bacteroidetes bacterium]|nr:GNAT family N-acetyltransferase [Bacteroidota bacterium]